MGHWVQAPHRGNCKAYKFAGQDTNNQIPLDKEHNDTPFATCKLLFKEPTYGYVASRLNDNITCRDPGIPGRNGIREMTR